MKYVLLPFLLFPHAVFSQSFDCRDTWYQGDGTQYGGVAGGTGGNCGLPVVSGNFYHAAMNQIQYDSSTACGACVRILGPKGEITLQIVDRCPECKFGDIDMTTEAFEQLADLKDGRIPIKWQYVTCPQANDIRIVFAPGSGPYYFKAQLRDSYYPISKLEYKKKEGAFQTIHREIYNYFVQEGGIDEDKQRAGPYHFRITSVTGQTLETDSVLFDLTHPVSTGVQFKDLACPDCLGIQGGTAKIDNCGRCSGGTSGISPNSTCQKDCNAYWEGTAYLDGCGQCVSGTTGATPCDKDCNGQAGGLAYIDHCGDCVAGTTEQAACTKDCANEWGGKASIDSCGRCIGVGSPSDSVPFPCISTGIDQDILTSLWEVFPTLSHSHFTAKAPIGSTLLLRDELGIVWCYMLFSQYVLEFGESLPQGLYFAQLVQDHIVSTKRIWKK